jgi:hypothetical protein
MLSIIYIEKNPQRGEDFTQSREPTFSGISAYQFPFRELRQKDRLFSATVYAY